MGIVRALFVVMLLLCVLTMGMYLVTGNVRYRQQSLRMFKWTLVVLGLFFAVLVAQRL